MLKTKLRLFNGVWVASANVYNVEVVSTADNVYDAMCGLKKAIDFIQNGLERWVGRDCKVS